MRKIIKLFLISLCILALTGCGGTSASGKEKIIIKYGTTLAPEHSLNKCGEYLKERMYELSDGRVEVQIFPSGQLGGEKAQIESLMAGGHDLHMGSQALISNWIPEYSVLDLPYLVYNEQEAEQLLKGEVGEKLLTALEDIGLYGMGWGENGFRLFTNNKNPVKHPEDFGGMIIRSMENKLMLDAMAHWGANPTPMSITEVYTALQQDTIDGQENPASLIYSQRFNEVQKYMSVSNHFYSPFVLYGSKAKIDRLPEDIKAMLFQACREACDYQIEVAREQNTQNIKDIEASGTEVYYFTDEDKSYWREKSEEIYEKYRPVIGEETFDYVMEEIEKIRGEQ
ncbi:MAG: TRAP transporter substrate-binding protein [Peptoniphilus sp.]|nr:TRAP transporter substrate-binding protein [Peptoniphilus sp.]